MANYTILIVLSDGTHRTTRWDGEMPNTMIRDTVLSQMEYNDPSVSIEQVVVALGTEVKVYPASDLAGW